MTTHKQHYTHPYKEHEMSEHPVTQPPANLSLTCLWISTGAWIAGDHRPNSKAELRRALADPDVSVCFDVEAPAGSHRSGEIIQATVEDVGVSELVVSGPDPDKDPTWWATVKVINGKVEVA